MSGAILVLNAGSSSIKYGLFSRGNDLTHLASGQVSRIGQDPVFRSDDSAERALGLDGDVGHEACLAWLMQHLGETHQTWNISAAGHRIVHGGTQFDGSVKITPTNLDDMAALTPLAPGHQPHNLAGVQAVADAWPAIDQVACFDTSFHRAQPTVAQLFPLPRFLSEQGVLRFGFHGLSYEHIAAQLPDLLGERADGRVIALHLGSGASICAIKDGQSVATTMGFTALGGLMMGTRAGDLDPGVLLYLLRDKNLSLSELETMLSHESGLLGVSGISADMRDLLASDDPRAAEAVDLFVDRTSQFVGAMMAVLAGVDAMVFTGGVGENAAAIRQRIVERFAWAGLVLDDDANGRQSKQIHRHDSDIAAFVVRADEESVIARHTKVILDGDFK